MGPNFRPFPGTNSTQSELSIDVHPLNGNIIFGSANATNWPFSTIYGTGVYWSTNGSNTWTGFNSPPFGTNSGDPVSVIGTNGYMYEGYITNSSGQGISVSTNGGTTWTSYTVAPNPGSLADKNHLTVDKKVGSPYENRVYDAWTDFGGVNDNNIVIKYSTNFGQTWSSAVNVSSTLNAGSHNQGVNVQTGPNGEVYAVWAIYDNWPGGEDAIGFAKSTNGGVSWTASRVYGALTPNGNFNFGIRGYIKPTSIRVSSFPSMAVDRNNGNIYVTWTQKGVTPAGTDPDIVMIKSTNGGTTWSSPVRVNDDPLNNTKDQYYSWITVDQSTGHVHLIFYDNRETTNDSSGVYMSYSVDGGNSFNNYRVSDHNFRPKPISGLADGYQGDYIGVAALSTIVYPYWSDDRTGNYQGWMSVINFGTPDTIPPDPVTDLAVTDPTSSSLKLTWTVTNDTSINGVTGYDIRFSDSPINDTTAFNNAALISFPGSPDTAGATESLIINGLSFNTPYYFRMKCRDIWGNWSDLSNSTLGTTYGAPSASVNPDSVHVDLMNNTTFQQSVVLSNISSGNSTLDYSVSLANNTFPEGMVQINQVPQNSEAENINTSKDNPTENHGQSIDGSGGPDAFGYKWIDSDEPNGPQYVWQDISATGTAVTNWIATGTFNPKDEGYAGPFNLGFNFKFYGNTKTQIYVSTNGLLLFGTVSTNIYTNASIPTAAVPNEYIAPFWDDLDGINQGTVHYKQDGNRFIIQFTNWQKYSGTGSLTFQVVLYSSGKILVYYNNMNATLNSATIGLENNSGTTGLQVAYNANYVHNNLALQFSAEPDWLGATPLSGRLYNNNSVDINLVFNTEDFPLGNYSMDLIVNSNDPVNPTITVPVTMTITSVPVELSSLSAQTEKNDVTLRWTTASETNNRGFEIQKSKS